MANFKSHSLLLFSFFFFFSTLLNVSISSDSSPNQNQNQNPNPFSVKASLIRYWNGHVSNTNKPDFLFNKASPLTGPESAILTTYLAQNSLSDHLDSFCKSANLVCFPDPSPILSSHTHDVHFSSYTDRNFTNYQTGSLGGSDSFTNYSDNLNIVADSFKRYSRNSNGHQDSFSNYAPDGNVVDSGFSGYGSGTTGGTGDFSNYAHNVNVPNLHFTSYDSDSNGRNQGFSSYSVDANAGDQSFASYGKRGNGVPLDFKSYGKNSNVMGSTFSAYSELGNGANDSFTSYGDDGNVPINTFRSYGDGGNGGVDSFTSYRDSSNVGDSSFSSYGKNSNAATVNFKNYGHSFNEGSEQFKGYRNAQSIGFKIYGVNNTFKDYAKTGVKFSSYSNTSSNGGGVSVSKSGGSSKWVEPGKFFRESMLKKGNVMPFPNIRDPMPVRSFLPRSIAGKLPFSSSKISELTKIFHAGENSSMKGWIEKTIGECEREPSKGETKKCATSIEDMIDFAVSVLGKNVEAKGTESVNGSGGDVEIGEVKGINGGKVTKSVSCHQSLFPYLVYYCHSVPLVRVYEAKILDVKSKVEINRGVAICHLDTTVWSPNHAAFMALGSKPGKIEVCHWIFENDLTWVAAD